MRDSWIDKKELEELVEEFSSSKGKSRKRGPEPGRREGSEEPGLGGPESPVKLKGEGERLGFVPNTHRPHSAVEKRPFLDDPATSEDADLVQDSDAAVEDLELIGGTAEECYNAEPSSFFDPEPFDPDAPELEFGLFELDDESDVPSVSLMVGSETGLPVFASIEAVSTEAGPAEGIVSNLTVESPSIEGSSTRKIPNFLGGTSEAPETRQQPISVRDADRAISSLAEARAKVDESRLLHILPQGKPVPTNTEVETEKNAEVSLVNATPGINERRRMTAEAGGYLHTRLEIFGDSVQRELGASEVAVCDADGFLLYTSHGFGIDKALHHSLLLQVSGKMNTLLGLDKESVSQLSDGSGIWRCLISGNGRQGNFFAGFSLPKPLEKKEVEVWKTALLETVITSRQYD